MIFSNLPQGSKLGPLLFIMYLNDIKNLNLFSKMFIYADDITLICSAKSIQKLIDKCNSDLIKIENFCNSNHLKLNINKTKGMLMLNEENIGNILIDNKQIEIVKDFKILSYNLNYKLNFNNHLIS